MADALSLLDAALRGTLLTLALLLAALLWRDRPRLAAARAGVALCLGLALQTVSGAPWVEATLPRLWQAPLVAVSVANAVLFWIFVAALFDDGFRLLPRHVAAWAGVALLSGFNCAVMADSGSILAPLGWGLQRAVPLVFSVLAALAAAALWRSDLVEGRRRLRVFIVGTGVVYTLAMLAARLASPQGRLVGALAMAEVLAMLLILAVVAWRLLQLGTTELLPLPATAAATSVLAPPDAADERLAAALQRLMAAEHAYRGEDLTLASLAARLAVPEYRLRRHINQRLGHRNFNAFVNGWRLDAARRALADPSQRRLPVLSIALESGFQSIGPFNRAFKAATGLTPTEFRQKHLADS
jgi:AraC-like DNA-binding protein